MRILDRYIGKSLISLILLVSLTLLAVDLLFYFVNEIRYIGKGNYGVLQALIYVALTIPRKIYIMFPWAALLGALLALGVLAKQSELVIMQASAISIKRITWAVVKAGLIMALGIFILGEFLAPKAEKISKQRKTYAMSQGQAIQTQYGTWIRNSNEFVHVGKALSNSQILDITTYEFDGNLKLKQVASAKKADFNPDQNSWQLADVKATDFTPTNTKTKTYKNITVEDLLDVDLLEISGVKHLERLSLFSLWQVINIREDNELNVSSYKLAFWSKIFHPLAVVVMVFLAVPFVFGPLRDSSMGLKFIAGILTGFTFHTLNTMFAPMVTVIGMPAFIAAVLPTFIFVLIGFYIMKTRLG